VCVCVKSSVFREHRVIHWKSSDVSERYVTSIFSVEGQAKLETSMKQVARDLCMLTASHWSLALLIHWLWRWRWRIPLKHQLTTNGPHGSISQNTELFITTGEPQILQSMSVATVTTRCDTCRFRSMMWFRAWKFHQNVQTLSWERSRIYFTGMCRLRSTVMAKHLGSSR
jgi:hypothetical protein